MSNETWSAFTWRCPKCSQLNYSQNYRCGNCKTPLVDVLEGGNQPEPTVSLFCCDKFGDAENKLSIIATDQGWAVADGDVIMFDIQFCPFCGKLLPRIKA